MPVPQKNNQFSCAGIILKNRQDACSTKKQSVFLWGGHLARPKQVYMDKT
ncbi:hypothetical protein [Microcoleus sp. B4-C3]